MILKQFNKAICLTVDKRLIQAQNLKSKVESLGCPCDLFVVGQGTQPIKYDYIDNQKWGQPQNYKQCFRQIIQRAKDEHLPSFLYLEDDADIRSNFEEIVSLALNELNNKHWDMIYFGANHNESLTYLVSPHLIKASRALDLHCVVIRNTVYDRLLDLCNHPYPHMDNLVARLHPFLQVYAVYPNVAYQSAGEVYAGHIEDKTTYYEKYGYLVDVQEPSYAN